MDIARFLDFANHHAQTKPGDIRDLCEKVRLYGLHAAFVNPCYVKMAKEILGKPQGDLGYVGTVVSFPLGQDTTENKIHSSLDSVRNGADELDISSNIGFFLAQAEEETLAEMKKIVHAVKELKETIIVKFIIETSLLAPEGIARASLLVLQSGADFVKTGSGMGPRGTTLEDMRFIKEAVGERIRIKVAGGVTTRTEAEDFLSAGASRIGTSHAIEIIKGTDENIRDHKTGE